MLIREGNYRGTSAHLLEWKSEMFSHLQTTNHARRQGKFTLWLMKKKYLAQWVAAAAFIKGSLNRAGGHLTIANRGLSYVRIPKAASTSLCKTMLLAQAAGIVAEHFSPAEINFVTALHLQKKAGSVTRAGTVFTLVRNPFSRIVSVYREFFERGKKPFIFEDYLFGILKQDMSFAQFVNAVNQIPDVLKDQHLKPQHLFLSYYESEKIPVTVMKLEEPEQIGRFLEKFGLQFGLFNQSESTYDYRHYYDRETLDIARDIYKSDLTRFGYWDSYRALEFMVEQQNVQI